MAFQNFVTPKVKLLYPHVKESEKYQGKDTGKYSVTIAAAEGDSLEKFCSFLDAEWEKALSTCKELQGKSFRKGSLPNLGYKEDKNGNLVVKFKQSTQIKTKAGEILDRTVPVFDAQGKPMEEAFGTNSIGKVAFSLKPYYMSNQNYGLSLYLNGIQVLEFVPAGGGQSASGLGFGIGEGYSTTTTNTPQDSEDVEVPFMGNDSEGADF